MSSNPAAAHAGSGGPTPAQPGAPPPMIWVDHATKQIADKEILHDLTFEVRQGEIFGFIGPSGSGKTTTIRLLTGVFAPTQGRIRVMGIAPTHPSRQLQERFGYMPQLFVLYPNLTVWENLNFTAGLYGINPFRRHRRIRELLKFVELWDARNKLASNVSGGMQRRIELAASLLNNPRLLFADEPTAGIDPVLRGKFWEEFHRLRDEGRTIFITTQYVGESEYCDRLGVIRKGRLIAVDTPLGLRRAALGGDVVNVEASELSPGAVQSLLQLGVVTNIKPVARDKMQVYVKEAGPAIPMLLEQLQNEGCTVNRIEEYKPSFDEVFISLMRRDAEAHGEQNEETA